MVGAFTGGMGVVQGALRLVAHFGNINPQIHISKLGGLKKIRSNCHYRQDVKNVNIKTDAGVGLFSWQINWLLTVSISPKRKKLLDGSSKENTLSLFQVKRTSISKDITIIDQKRSTATQSIFCRYSWDSSYDHFRYH